MSDNLTAGDVLKLEYDALKREQNQRITTRDNLVYATLAATGLVIAGIRQGGGLALALLLPPVVLVLGWTRLSNDIKVSHISAYLRGRLAAGLEAITGEPALEWEYAYRCDRRRRLRKVCQTVADLTLFAVAPLAALITYWVVGAWSVPLLVVSIAEAAAVVGMATMITLDAAVGLFEAADRTTPGAGS